MTTSTTLALTDPLADREVRIVVHVTKPSTPAAERGSRAIVVAVGVEGATPRMLTGTFDRLVQLVDEAWRTYRVFPCEALTETAPGTLAETTAPGATDAPPSAPPEANETADTTASPSTTARQAILDLF